MAEHNDCFCSSALFLNQLLQRWQKLKRTYNYYTLTFTIPHTKQCKTNHISAVLPTFLIKTFHLHPAFATVHLQHITSTYLHILTHYTYRTRPRHRHTAAASYSIISLVPNGVILILFQLGVLRYLFFCNVPSIIELHGIVLLHCTNASWLAILSLLLVLGISLYGSPVEL